jgi:hypothetical protein
LGWVLALALLLVKFFRRDNCHQLHSGGPSMPIATIVPSEQDKSLHQKFKVVFLGDEKGTNNLSINYYIDLFLVGKSSLITRFTHDSVDDTYQVNFDVFSFS